jgi:hypothetical protein
VTVRARASFALALAAAPASARAAACPVRLLPADAAPGWREAVAEAAARLAAPGSAHDCRAVEVVVGPTGSATLAFVTTDGRGAARALEAPADLGPALEALLVTRLPSSEAPAEPRRPQDSPPPPPPRPELHLHLGAATGVRMVGQPVSFATPVFALRAAIGLDRWELGLAADFAPHHRPLAGGAPEAFALTSFATGLTVGRREPVGGASLAYGFSVAVQASSEEAADLAAVTTSRSLDVALPRLGLYARLAYPKTARARFTADLGLDVALGNLRLKSTEERQLPALPRLGAALALGVELAVL